QAFAKASAKPAARKLAKSGKLGDSLLGGNISGIASWLDTPEPVGFRPKRKYRTVWISDVHLGTRGCNAEMLLQFLRSIETETLYL
ncbi:hypothetical protein NL462_27185, partial [Klebsiella pneumoniae]|nr:hypothetical protein [Klebsiella pneumoniae]